MTARLRQAIRRAVTHTQLYRVIPPSSARDYAAVRYLADHASPEQLSRYIERSGRVPQHASAATAAASAALATSRDDLARRILDEAIDRFPGVSELHVAAATLAAFHGDHEAAAESATVGWLLDPGSEDAASKAIRYRYLAGHDARANHDAVQAIRRFPESSPVLWAAATGCQDADQYGRLADAWEATIETARQLRAGVRPLSAAAARAGLLDAAIELCAEGILLRLEGVGSGVVRGRRLGGKGAWGAIEDVVEVMAAADIPYFFAAGTALGLIREGRPLGHDSDIDLGVLEADWDRAALQKAFKDHPRFIPDEVHPKGQKLGFRHRGGSPIDIFRFYEEGGRIWHNGTFVRWHNSPFEVVPTTLRGIELPLPEDPDSYLTENYGNWRIPDPGFDAFTDAPNVEVVWPEYYDYHLMRRAYARVTAGEVSGMLADVSAAEPSLRRLASGRRLLEAVGHG